MAISQYVANLRKHVGTDLLVLPAACAVVVDDTGRVLLSRRADSGRWSLPAGAIDPGEQQADAAVREVYEETGVRIAVEGLAGVALREVTSAVGWYSPEELPDLDAVDQLRVATALDDEAPAWFAVPGQAFGWLPARS